MLGYCVRSEETTSTALAEHGVVAVHEYMERFYTTGVTAWEWAERLQAAIEMADLLDYLEHSPLGSLRISDFKVRPKKNICLFPICCHFNQWVGREFILFFILFFVT